MTQVAVVFPGQGCQFVGMGADLAEAFPHVGARLREADEVLGFPLSRLCFEGPAETLNDTANTQPAIYAVTVALWEVFASRLAEIDANVVFAAGHSLGEYAALTAAGALDYPAGVRLVRERGLAMREAGESAPGGMAAVLGLDDDTVHEIVGQVRIEGYDVWVANYNSPGQVVIAGSQEGLAKAMELAQARRAKKVIPLAVSVACHTPLMRAAAERFGAALAEVDIHPPCVPVVSNVTATPLTEPEAIRAALLRQLSSPVRWVESVQTMVRYGVEGVIEVGPKAVVSALVRRIDEGLLTLSVTDVSSLLQVSEMLGRGVPA